MNLKSLVQSQIVVAMAINKKRNWDRWAAGMTMVLGSPLDSPWTEEEIAAEIKEQLLTEFFKGCCDA